MDALKRLSAVAVYALAMAYVEAAVVAYLREIYDIKDIVRDAPATPDRFTAIETGREAATLVMLLAVGWIAGSRLQDRLGYFVVAFGLWDIAYYAWLSLLVGWPDSLLDWDVLFLIPVPWWSPVLAPTLIAALMCVGGVAVIIQARRGVPWRQSPLNVGTAAAGLVIVLYTFTADSLGALSDGLDAVANARPSDFPWPLFLLGFILMSWGGLRVTWPGSSRVLRT